MHPIPSPPTSIDEIPEKCIAAWQSLGAELNESALATLRSTWTSQRFGVFVHHLRQVRETVPVERLPGWRDGLMSLLRTHPEAYEAHGAFLVDACIHLLEARDVLSIAGNVAITDKQHLPQAWMRGFMPRSRGEREGLAELIEQTTDPATQAAALDLLARPGNARREDEADKSFRQSLLVRALPHVVDEALKRFVDNNSDFGGLAARDLSHNIEVPGLLVELAERGSLGLRRNALQQLWLLQHGKDGQDLAPYRGRLKALLAADPVSFRKADTRLPDVELATAAWDGADGDKMRDFVLRWVASLFDDEGLGPVTPEHPALPLLLRMLEEAPSNARVWFWNPEHYSPYAEMPFPLLQLLWQAQPKSLLPLFAQWLAACIGRESEWPVDWRCEEAGEPHVAARRSASRQLIAEVLSAATTDLETVKPGDVANLLPHISDLPLLEQLTPSLQALGAKSKPLQRALPELLARFGATEVQRLGWLADKRKGVRDIGLEALLLCQGSEAERVLQQVRDDARTSDTDRDRIHARLGVATSGDSPAVAGATATTEASSKDAAAIDLDSLKARAAKARIKPAVDKVWSEELATALQPLPPEYARWLLSLAVETKEERLTGTALGLLAHLSRERQAALSEHLLRLWLANNGDRKLIWLLLFVPPCGDDRLVEPLFEAFKAWHKRAKPKAVTVLQTLAALDSAFALSQVYEVFAKATYSWAIHEGAKAALQGAAGRRGCSLADLFDEITPDFGLTTEGRVFDFGPYAYTMRVGTDLELSFTHSTTGKTSKSLPKAKDGEDLEARAAAESAIKLLRGGLKKVIKLQAQRLEDAMVVQRRWPAARWRVLFVDHAVLGLIGQGLIWDRLDARGTSLGSLRISEDRSLIDASSQTVALDDSDQLQLWHPATARAGEVEAWTAHLADYEIKPFLSQVGRPVITLTAEEAESTEFKRHAKVRVAQSTIKYGLEGWNYQISDQDGSHIAGFERRFEGGLRVLIDTDDMDAGLYGDAALGSAAFLLKREPMKLADVPAPLLSLVAEHLQKLAAKAEG